MNPIQQYWQSIEKGNVVVNNKIRRIYKKMVDDMHDDESVYEYDEDKANHAIKFIESFCKHSKGKLGGKPFKLELWQKAMTAALFGFVHKIDGNRKYRELIMMVGRKNGKSAWASAIGLYMLMGDGEPGPEVISAAKRVAAINWAKSVETKVDQEHSLRNKSQYVNTEVKHTLKGVAHRNA